MLTRIIRAGLHLQGRGGEVVFADVVVLFCFFNNTMHGFDALQAAVVVTEDGKVDSFKRMIVAPVKKLCPPTSNVSEDLVRPVWNEKILALHRLLPSEMHPSKSLLRRSPNSIPKGNAIEVLNESRPRNKKTSFAYRRKRFNGCSKSLIRDRPR